MIKVKQNRFNQLSKAFIPVLATGLLVMGFSEAAAKTDDYELSPFKLKELPPQREQKDPLETLRVQSTLKGGKPIQRYHHQIGVRVGYPFIFGTVGDFPSTILPYFALTYRYRFLELGLGYYYSKVDTGKQVEKVHAFPLTLSLVWDIDLSRRVRMIPKFGGGFMLHQTQSSFLGRDTLRSIVIKPALDFAFGVSDSFYINVGAGFIIAQNVESTFGTNLSYFLIPTLGVTFHF